MFSLVVAILFGLSITFFAFQNSINVPIVIGNLFLQEIPVYLVVIVSVLVGIFMAWFISALEGMSYFMNIRQKESVINKDKKEMSVLQRKIHDLEMENARLRGSEKDVLIEERHEDFHDDTNYKPSFWHRIFPHSTRHYSKQI